MKRTLRVLGIETSCDETSAAVVETAALALSERSESKGPPQRARGLQFQFRMYSNVIASQVAIHAKYGGVVPEVAAREHVTAIMPTVEQALIGVAEAFRPPRTRVTGGNLKVSATSHGIDAIAVTAGPGLITSLSVGVETARTLAYAWEKPLIAVNHIEGHVLSALLPPFSPPHIGRGSERGREATRNSSIPTLRSGSRHEVVGTRTLVNFPALALVVSGGHTELLLMRGWGRYECIGATRDDAAGEAFDKVGKLLGLPDPGGPAVAKAAEGGDPTAFNFPRGMLHSKDYEFSFSGLKTAVRYFVAKMQNVKCKIQNCTWMSQGSHSSFCIHHSAFLRNVCASFQVAVVDVLVAKTIAAAQRYRVKTILLGGGVAANQKLRRRLSGAVRSELAACSLQLAAPAYTGDNAAMIAAAGGVRLLLGDRTPWERLDVDANWELGR